MVTSIRYTTENEENIFILDLVDNRPVDLTVINFSKILADLMIGLFSYDPSDIYPTVQSIKFVGTIKTRIECISGKFFQANIIPLACYLPVDNFAMFIIVFDIIVNMQAICIQKSI